MAICIDYEILAGVFYCKKDKLPLSNLIYAIEELEEGEEDTVSAVASAIKESQNETNELLHTVINNHDVLVKMIENLAEVHN
jgi:hypothetical protein